MFKLCPSMRIFPDMFTVRSGRRDCPQHGVSSHSSPDVPWFAKKFQELLSAMVGGHPLDYPVAGGLERVKSCDYGNVCPTQQIGGGCNLPKLAGLDDTFLLDVDGFP